MSSAFKRPIFYYSYRDTIVCIVVIVNFHFRSVDKLQSTFSEFNGIQVDYHYHEGIAHIHGFFVTFCLGLRHLEFYLFRVSPLLCPVVFRNTGYFGGGLQCCRHNLSQCLKSNFNTNYITS